MRLDDHSQVFNTKLFAALELGFMLDAAEATGYAALAREESRGAHTRRDCPARHDTKYLAHSLTYRTGGPPRVEFRPIRITRWLVNDVKVSALWT